MNELEVVKTVETYLNDVKRSKVRDIVANLYQLYKDKDVELDKANNEINCYEHIISEKDDIIEAHQVKITKLRDTNNTLDAEKVSLSRLLENSKSNYTKLLSERSILQTSYDDSLTKNRTQDKLIKDLQEKVAKLRSVIGDNQKDIAKFINNASCFKRKYIFYKIAFLAALGTLLATLAISLS